MAHKGTGFPYCTLSEEDGKIEASCINGFHTTVPADLDENLQILDLSNNLKLNLSADSFHRYPNLEKLTIDNIFDNITHKTEIHQNAFISLKKLINLQFNNVFFENIKINWPLSLRTLSLNKDQLHHLNLTTLHQLQDLSVADNYLKDVPQISPLAPLKKLDIRHNSLEDVTAKSLAQLCTLEHIELILTETSHLNTNKTKFCQCVSVEKWLKKVNLTGTIKLECDTSNPGINAFSCPDNFEEANVIRDQCLNISRVNVNPTESTSSSSSSTWKFIAIPLILILIFAFLALVYRFFKTRGPEYPPDAETYPTEEPVIEETEGEEDLELEE